jgi:hypothetical protein
MVIEPLRRKEFRVFWRCKWLPEISSSKRVISNDARKTVTDERVVRDCTNVIAGKFS